MKILIFGVRGMLGNALFKYFSMKEEYSVFGTSRLSENDPQIYGNVDVLRQEEVENIIAKIKPDIILNAVGIIKQKKSPEYENLCIKINSLWPRELENLSERYQFRIIHFSTDCVFSGKEGMYRETSIPDEKDIYGLTKYLGEITGPRSLTLRTSIIGHELKTNVSLVDWFLSQKDEVDGFANVIYSGFPVIYIAKFIEKYLLGGELNGMYHLSSDPISKYDLLKLIANVYSKNIKINKNIEFKLNRSLDSRNLREKLNWHPPRWDSLIHLMYEYRNI